MGIHRAQVQYFIYMLRAIKKQFFINRRVVEILPPRFQNMSTIISRQEGGRFNIVYLYWNKTIIDERSVADQKSVDGIARDSANKSSL